MSERLRLGAVAVLVLAGVAGAQDGGLRPVDEGRNPNAWYDPDAPQPAPQPARQAGQDDSMGLPPAGSQPEKTPEERAREGRIIDRNYGEALRIYEETVQPHGRLDSLDRRIANNERLVEDYRGRIAGAQEELRILQVERYNRTFNLEREVEQGRLSRDVFDRQVRQEELRYAGRSQTLQQNLASWNEEMNLAQQRLAEMRAQRQTLTVTLPRQHRPAAQPVAAPPPPRPSEVLVGTLSGQLQQLNAFSVRHHLQGAHPRDVILTGPTAE